MWDLADLCNYYGRNLSVMVSTWDPEIELDLENNDSCLCPLGGLDNSILEDLGIQFNTHDDGSISIIYFPPFLTPVSVFEIET
jgi:hypothetical protein